MALPVPATTLHAALESLCVHIKNDPNSLGHFLALGIAIPRLTRLLVDRLGEVLTTPRKPLALRLTDDPARLKIQLKEADLLISNFCLDNANFLYSARTAFPSDAFRYAPIPGYDPKNPQNTLDLRKVIREFEEKNALEKPHYSANRLDRGAKVDKLVADYTRIHNNPDDPQQVEDELEFVRDYVDKVHILGTDSYSAMDRLWATWIHVHSAMCRLCPERFASELTVGLFVAAFPPWTETLSLLSISSEEFAYWSFAKTNPDAVVTTVTEPWPELLAKKFANLTFREVMYLLQFIRIQHLDIPFANPVWQSGVRWILRLCADLLAHCGPRSIYDGSSEVVEEHHEEDSTERPGPVPPVAIVPKKAGRGSKAPKLYRCGLFISRLTWMTICDLRRLIYVHNSMPKRLAIVPCGDEQAVRTFCSVVCEDAPLSEAQLQDFRSHISRWYQAFGYYGYCKLKELGILSSAESIISECWQGNCFNLIQHKFRTNSMSALVQDRTMHPTLRFFTMLVALGRYLEVKGHNNFLDRYYHHYGDRLQQYYNDPDTLKEPKFVCLGSEPGVLWRGVVHQAPKNPERLFLFFFSVVHDELDSQLDGIDVAYVWSSLTGRTAPKPDNSVKIFDMLQRYPLSAFGTV